MKLNKFKSILSIVIYFLVSSLCSETQCMNIIERLERMENEIRDLNMTLVNLNNSVVPIGSIIEYSGNTPVPNNWLECVGQAVSRIAYPELLNVIGVTYGIGDGLNTFNLPDRRGRVAVGIGSNNNTGGLVTQDTAPNIGLGKTFGEERHVLTVGEMPSHSHSIGYHWKAEESGITRIGGLNPLGGSNNDAKPVTSTGDNQPHNNMQPSIFMKFYIRAK